MEDPSEESPSSEHDSDYEVSESDEIQLLQLAAGLHHTIAKTRRAKERLRIRNKKQALAKIWQLIASPASPCGQ